MAFSLTMKYMVLEFCIWSFSLLVITQAAREKDEFRIFNRDFKPTSIQMLQMLQKADLEGKGFTKEITTRIITTRDTSSTENVTEYHYYKVVSCNNLASVQNQLSKLLPGVWGKDVSSRVRNIAKRKSLDDSNQCTAGIEVHFPKPSCQAKPARDSETSFPYISRVRRQLNKCSIWCLICFLATSEN